MLGRLETQSPRANILSRPSQTVKRLFSSGQGQRSEWGVPCAYDTLFKLSAGRDPIFGTGPAPTINTIFFPNIGPARLNSNVQSLNVTNRQWLLYKRGGQLRQNRLSDTHNAPHVIDSERTPFSRMLPRVIMATPITAHHLLDLRGNSGFGSLD